MEVAELLPGDGQALARSLILGEGLRCTDPDETAEAIAALVDCIPFYIHQVISRMVDRGEEASADVARAVVQEALVSAHNEWHLKHFRERLDHYYQADKRQIVLRVLDDVAVADEPLLFADLVNRLRSGIPRERADSDFVRIVLDGDDEVLRPLLDLLQRDNYLRRDSATGGYAFRFPLIKRWWRLDRSLA